jgi:exportin-T
VQYATDTSDVSVEKVAFGVLNKMVVVWSDPFSGSTSVDGEGLASGFHDAFGQFVIGHLSRVCFEVPSKSTFNPNDAQSRLVSRLSIILSIQVLAEIAGLQKSIFHMKGDAFSSYLQANFFPSLGVPPAAADEYVRALKQLDLKQFKKYFLVFSILLGVQLNVDICEQVILWRLRSIPDQMCIKKA